MNDNGIAKNNESNEFSTKRSFLLLLSVIVERTKWQAIFLIFFAIGFTLTMLGGLFLYLGITIMVILVVMAIIIDIPLRLKSIGYEAHFYNGIKNNLFKRSKHSLEQSSISSLKNYLTFGYILIFVSLILFFLYQVFVRL